MAKNLTLGVAEYVLLLRDEMSKAAGDALDQMDSRFALSARNMQTLGVASENAGRQIIGGFSDATMAAADFETGVHKIATLGVDNLGDMRKAVLDVSATYGLDLTNAANAAYDAISSGVPAAEVPLFLGEAAKSATAGVTDLNTAVSLGTSVTNAYGLEFGKVGTVYDQAFIAAKDGVTTFEELANSIGQVAPTAKATGVQTDELFSSVAALTLAGIDTSQSVTGMKAALSNIIKPTKDAENTAAALGLQFDAGAIKTKGWTGFLNDLRDKTGGNVETMGMLFGSVEGMNAMLALAGEQNQAYNQTLGHMRDGQWGVNQAFEAFAKDNPAFEMEKFNAEWKVLKVELGEAVLPALNDLLKIMRPMVDKFREFATVHPDVTKGLIGITGTAGALLVVGGKVLEMMALWKIAFATAGWAAGGLAGGAAAAAGGGAAAGAAGGGALVVAGESAGGAAAAGGGLAGVAAAAELAGASFGAMALTVVGGTAGVLLATGQLSQTQAVWDDYGQSQKDLADTEKQVNDTLRAKGVALDEASMKGLDYAQREQYRNLQEQKQADATLRAWLTYFLGRKESEEEFAQAKNILLNENMTAETAAAAVSKGLADDKMQALMQADKATTQAILDGLDIQQTADTDVQQAIVASASGAAMDRQETWIASNELVASKEQELGSAVQETWKGVVEYIKEWYEWIMSLFEKVWNAMPSMSGPLMNAPQMASGGLVKRGGLVAVHADERIVLPAGAEVVPRSHSAAVDRAMKGGGGDVHVVISGPIHLSGDMDVDRMARRLGRKVRAEMAVRGLPALA